MTLIASNTSMTMYNEIQFNLPAMGGLSERQITEHLKLYGGYVKNTNALLDKLHNAENEADPDFFLIAELRRRLGFEWNGMRLHELYFSGLGGMGGTASDLIQSKISSAFGSYEKWVTRFKSAGLARGIGWVLLVYDRKAEFLQNIWVGDHDIGHLAGTEIILAMDIWEHAYLLDYLPSQKKDYIEAFFANLNWAELGNRFAHTL